MKINSIDQVKSLYPHLVHASNILVKKRGSLKPAQAKAMPRIEREYLKYIKAQLTLVGYTDEIIVKRVELLNDYYNFLAQEGYENLFTSQSKFRSTILEEFIYILFKDLIADFCDKLKIENNELLLGGVKAYTNLYFKSEDLSSFVKDIHTGINVKDQDFAIYREMLLSINGSDAQPINLPIIAIECKTYLDKTMLEGAIATAEKIKSGNPYSKFYVVTETYEVDLQVDPAYSRIDQIFVLRKFSKSRQEKKDVFADVVKLLVVSVQEHLSRKWGDIESKITNKGVVI